MLDTAAAAAAKSLQSCPTLCDPIDGSPPGSLVPGILQARTLEGVAISFSNPRKWKVKVKSFSRVRLFATPWTGRRSLPGSSIHGIFQARVLEWVAIAFSCLILHWVNGCSINSCPSESTQQIKLTFNHDSRIEWNCCFEHMANDNYYGFKKKALDSRGKQKHFNVK